MAQPPSPGGPDNPDVTAIQYRLLVFTNASTSNPSGIKNVLIPFSAWPYQFGGGAQQPYGPPAKLNPTVLNIQVDQPPGPGVPNIVIIDDPPHIFQVRHFVRYEPPAPPPPPDGASGHRRRLDMLVPETQTPPQVKPFTQKDRAPAPPVRVPFYEKRDDISRANVSARDAQLKAITDAHLAAQKALALHQAKLLADAEAERRAREAMAMDQLRRALLGDY
jgi:hypothetical protein